MSCNRRVTRHRLPAHKCTYLNKAYTADGLREAGDCVIDIYEHISHIPSQWLSFETNIWAALYVPLPILRLGSLFLLVVGTGHPHGGYQNDNTYNAEFTELAAFYEPNDR